MKLKLFFSMLIAAFSAVTLSANPTKPIDEIGNFVVSVKGSTNGKTLSVNLSNSYSDDFTISIEDAYGRIIHEEKLNDVKLLRKKFNLSQLEVGNYSLKIAQSKIKTIQPFEIKFEDVAVDESKKMVKINPTFKMKANFLEVTVPIIEKSVEISIFDMAGNILHTEEADNISALRKRFNLKNLQTGKFLIEVNTDGETYYYNIQL